MSTFSRPGVSDEHLVRAGCAHVSEEECARLFGFKAAGIAIPFRTIRNEPILDGGRPFARVRLYEPTDNQKYHQRPGSGIHIYIPPNFADRIKGSTLVLAEGEFKSAALSEAGYPALGLCGLTGAAQTITKEGEYRHVLNDELVGIILTHRPATVAFLGDADVVFNSQFANEAAKLRKLLCESRQFSFVDRVLAVKCPVNGPKGIDDCREVEGENFPSWFDSLLAGGLEVPPKATPSEIFCALLRRESEAVRAASSGDDHQSHRNRVHLLQSAGKLQSETGAMLLLRPLLAGLLNVAESALTRIIRDAGKPTIEDGNAFATPEKGRVTLRNVEPWDKPVGGDELLTEIAGFYNKFVVLPASAADVLAAWVLQTWCYEHFEFAAIVAVWSPEEACGKGRVLDVTEKVVRRPFRTSNTSAAVLYHVISKGNLTVLVDELDSISVEQRDAICNILKGGFQANGTAHRMTERNGEHVEVEFPTFCPKMVATITLDKLDKATRSRTIGIRMQRKPRFQKVAKFRRVDATVLQRKCMRWALDHLEAIKAVPPIDVDECATDRQEDVWEPLVVIGRVAGGDWESRIRLAAHRLTGDGSDGASDTVAHQLLASLQAFFTEHGDRGDTKAIIAALKESGDFDDVNCGRGLSPHYVAKLLKPYGIEPRVHKTNEGKTARGYSRSDCEQAFATYLSKALPKNPSAKCNSVTSVDNQEGAVASKLLHEQPQLHPKNGVSPCSGNDGYGVTVSSPKSVQADKLLI